MSGALVAYLVISLALWGSRLFSVLHAESAAVIAFAGFFIAGLHTLSPANRDASIGRLLYGHLLLLLLPLSLLTLSLLWVPNCAYWTGLLLFGVFTFPSVVLGVASASWIRTWRTKWKRIVFLALGLSVVVGGVAFDLGLHPQFYVLNHVFGAVLGPVYEEALYVRPALFLFRILTLLWALLFFLLGARQGGVVVRMRSRFAIPSVALAIALAYFFASPLGLNTSYHKIETALGSVTHSRHFDIYYDASTIDERTIERIAADHEFEYERIRGLIGIEPRKRIRSYLYPTIRTKIELTGAGATDVSPVWLQIPQMHILQDSYVTTLSHELAHVFSREIGLPVLRASLLAGLIEGLAVALEPADGRPTVHEQVAVAGLERAGGRDVGLAGGLARDLEGMLDPVSFWTGRAPVSYTMTGSFVRYLVERYGPERLRSVYARGNFESGYGVPLTQLSADWEFFVRRLPIVSVGTRDLVYRRFTIPSLFEKRCPHYLPPHVAAYREARDCLARRDTAAAVTRLNESLRREVRYMPALALWSRLSLVRGDGQLVVERVANVPDSIYSPALHVYYGDALSLHGDSVAALLHYRAAAEKLPPYERDARALVLVRRLFSGSSGPVEILYAPSVDLKPVSQTPALRIASALRLADKGNDAEAAETLAELDWDAWADASSGERELLNRMILVWAARLYHRAGQHSEAERMYARALIYALRVGDFNHAAQIEHQIQRVRWRG